MQVKRPAVGAEGFVLDHLNRAATDSYLKTVGDRLFQAFGTTTARTRSSATVSKSTTPIGVATFSKSFKSVVATISNHICLHSSTTWGRRPKSLRRDWGRTHYELLNERFPAPMQEWSKRNQTRFRIQDYGVPAAAISSNAFADIPDGEGAQWKIVRAARWASSASHLYNRPVTHRKHGRGCTRRHFARRRSI